jgi:sugar lactone lactonase YvrE
MYAELTFPDVHPVYADMKADSEGNFWVTENWRKWTVFDAGGNRLGDIETPARFTIHQIGADFLLGLSRDELGVERVHRYGLLKPDPGRR